MKNHELADGKLLQTNKKYSHLKQKQKERIYQWMYDAYKLVYKKYIEKIGFLPLFRNEILGFSVEKHTAADSWWSEDPESDPWEWRKIIAGNGRIAYGRFFDKKAGFISGEWLPAFANYRRDDYDFDARWDDELASIRSKKIMDLFAEENVGREL